MPGIIEAHCHIGITEEKWGVAALLRKTLLEAIRYKKDKEEGNLQKDNFEMEPWIPVLNKEIPLKAHAHRADSEINKAINR